MVVEYRKFLRARNRLAIDEVLHYWKCGGAKSAISFFYAFHQDDVSFKEENKIIRGILTGDVALVENTITDIQEESKKMIIELRG